MASSRHNEDDQSLRASLLDSRREAAGGDAIDDAPPPSPPLDGAALALRQFGALLRKNAALALRSRRSLFGLGGAAALLLHVLLPPAFFALMWLPKHYIPTVHHAVFLQASSYDLDTKWWAGPSPYEGPAYHARNSAKVVLVPGTPQVHAVAGLLAAALACPDQRYKRICSPETIVSFGCLFGAGDAPLRCADDAAACAVDPECTGAAREHHISVAESEAAALADIEAGGHIVDALVVFGAPGGDGSGDAGDGSSGESGSGGRSGANGAAGSERGRSRWQQEPLDPALLSYTIRTNRSDVPAPGLLRDMFDVAPGEMPLPGNLLWYVQRVGCELSGLRCVVWCALLPTQSYQKTFTQTLKTLPPTKTTQNKKGSTAATGSSPTYSSASTARCSRSRPMRRRRPP
jgi:uncharacterized membrane protein YgcG